MQEKVLITLPKTDISLKLGEKPKKEMISWNHPFSRGLKKHGDFQGGGYQLLRWNPTIFTNSWGFNWSNLGFCPGKHREVHSTRTDKVPSWGSIWDLGALGIETWNIDEQTDGWEKEFFCSNFFLKCVKCGCTIDMFPGNSVLGNLEMLPIWVEQIAPSLLLGSIDLR